MGQGNPSAHNLPVSSDEPPTPAPISAAVAGSRSGSLVLNRDKSANDAPKRCPKPALGVRFRLPDGTIAPVPCGLSTCPVCSRRQGMITATMVGLDAAREQPRVVSTTTTRDRISPTRLRDGQHQFVRAVRREVAPHARYCSFLEFTTGTAERSGGIRRPHQHALWKGLDPSQAEAVEAIARRIWKRIAGATVHQVEEISTPAGATMYVASHHQKESQAPPKSWGPTRRVRPSRGYYSMPADELRAAATEKLADARYRHSLEQAMLDADVPDDVISEVLESPRSRPRPTLIRVREINGQLVEVIGDLR